eukprot:gene17-12830_t
MQAKQMNAAALLLLLIAGSAQLGFAQEANITGGKLTDGNLTGGNLSGWLDISPTTDICGVLGVQGPYTFKGCSSIVVLASALAYVSPAWDKMACNADAIDGPVNMSAHGTSLPYPLQDIVGDGPQVQVSTGNNMEPPVPQGWTHVHTVDIKETKNGDVDGFDDPSNIFTIPFASVIAQDNMLVILVFDSLQPILEQQVVKGRIHHVSIAGHSLGAGVSTILSYLVQQYINEAVPGLNRIQVDAFLFAPPNAGNKAFNKRLSEKVNIRSITFNYDVVPQVPCAPEMMACKGGILNPYPIPNTQGSPPQLSWDYRTQRGGVNFGAGLMPYQSDIF